LLNYTRIENAHEVRKKTFDFLLYIEVQQVFSFPFTLVRRYQMPECFMSTIAVFEIMLQLNHATETRNAANAVSTCAAQPQHTK